MKNPRYAGDIYGNFQIFRHSSNAILPEKSNKYLIAEGDEQSAVGADSKSIHIAFRQGSSSLVLSGEI